MGEKFNSGYGGYICDHCRRLLWAGRGGLQDPLKRKFIYSSTPESVVVKNNMAFCSKECADKGKEVEPE